MATWISHLIIADSVLEAYPQLDRHGFCIGNIAPDCNVENKDWSGFEPSREVTHWMAGGRKTQADSQRFYQAYLAPRKHCCACEQEISFLLGYYAHLIADAEFQRYIRDPQRVGDVWRRIKAHPVLSTAAKDMPETWDSVKQLISRDERMKDIYTIEAEYLDSHPRSGYLTEVLNLRTFPDYIDYLPQGAIPRKISVMGYLPAKETGAFPFIAMSREEYCVYLNTTVELVTQAIK